MKKILLVVESTGIYTPDELVKIIRDAVYADGIGDAYTNITVFTPPSKDEIIEHICDVLLEITHGLIATLIC